MEETRTRRHDAWIAFCCDHSDPGNIALHLLAWAAFWGGLLLGLMHQDPSWLLATLAAGPLARLGHELFEQETALEEVLPLAGWIPWHVGRMVFRVLIGRYADDVAAARSHRENLVLLAFWRAAEVH